MRDFNENIEIQKIDISECNQDELGKKLYKNMLNAINNMFYISEDSKEIKIMDLLCSQSYIKEFLPESDKIKYTGQDEKASFEIDGIKYVPDIHCGINNIPVADNIYDFIFGIGPQLAYGRNHQSIFEIERIIKSQGYLIVALSKYWFNKGFNQLLFCYRNWHYIKAIEISYKLINGEEIKETSRFFSIYQYKK